MDTDTAHSALWHNAYKAVYSELGNLAAHERHTEHNRRLKREAEYAASVAEIELEALKGMREHSMF